MPTHQAAAAVLIVNRAGNVLMVANPYRSQLVLPGGVIENDESPAAAAEREVRKETGLAIAVTRLLVMEHLAPSTDEKSGLRFVFDTEAVDDVVALVPQPDEVSELMWLSPREAVARHVPRGRHRLTQAFKARDNSMSVYIDRDVTLVRHGLVTQ